MSVNNPTYVECYSGYSYAQEPRTFIFEHEQRLVTDVRKRWREPCGPFFEVLADDGAAYLLAYNESADQWHVSLLHSRSNCVLQ